MKAQRDIETEIISINMYTYVYIYNIHTGYIYIYPKKNIKKNTALAHTHTSTNAGEANSWLLTNHFQKPLESQGQNGPRKNHEKEPVDTTRFVLDLPAVSIKS
jgi:hypothetical protein